MPLLITVLFFLTSIFCYLTDKKKLSLCFLVITGLTLRLWIISLDPFLHDWDERFHALVAKNLITHPFKPMLWLNPVSDYDPSAWCCNHIWLHKQPLFLWQMALSLKLFGISEIAVRIPSMIMGTLLIFFIYDIAFYWTKNALCAFVSAVFICFSYYHLELISGRLSLDHNDLAFCFYLTTALWAWIKYIKHDLKLNKWLWLTGFFLGCAVLIKWLTAFVLIGGWGLYILNDRKLRTDTTKYLHLILSIILSCLIFLPWQIFIKLKYPLESSLSYHHNWLHIKEAIGNHGGNQMYHLDYIPNMYGPWSIILITFGIIISFFHKEVNKKISISLFSIVAVIYAFFSLIVQTKMPAFPFMVNIIMVIYFCLSLSTLFQWLQNFLKIQSSIYGKAFILLSFLTLAYYCINLKDILNYRDTHNQKRNIKIHNTNIYKSIGEKFGKDYIIMNTKVFEDVELMFHQNVNTYRWFPSATQIDSFKNLGYKFAAFDSHAYQVLPDSIKNNINVQVIPHLLE